ncbi:MAG: SH3 domain-containing protein [Kiritimatiellales bacterium]
MKKILIGLTMIAGVLLAQDEGTVTVTADRVSLRAEPDANAVLLERALQGDEFILKDNGNPEWVGVVPPDSVDLWVSREFLENSEVLPSRLNVRSGPSLNHSIVGVLEKGQAVAVRGTTAEWMKIAPVQEATVWISRRYTDVKITAPAEPVEPAEAAVEIEEPAIVEETVTAVAAAERPAQETCEPPAEVCKQSETCPVKAPCDAKPAEECVGEETCSKKAGCPVASGGVTAPVDEPVVEEIIAAMEQKVPLRLKADTTKEQGIASSYSGILLPESDLLYKLVQPGCEQTVKLICYVRGNVKQLKTYSELPVMLSGKIYWAEGVIRPVIVPSKIQILNKLLESNETFEQ